MLRAFARGISILTFAVLLIGIPVSDVTAGAAPCSPEAARVEWRAPAVQSGQGATLDFDGLIDILAERRVVFVGESHDRFDHHLNQLEIICRLHARDPNIAIAMEFFQQPSQPHLDDYVEGRIDEASMLRATEYYERWRYDYRLYQPILDFARANAIPLVALNVPSELTRKVGREGIAGLSEEERAGLPVGLDQVDEGYRARLKAAFEEHPERSHGDFETFLQVQLLWDTGMAEATARYMKAHSERRIVVLAGNGHALRSGIPERLARRNSAESAVVLQGAHSAAYLGAGDFLLDSKPLELPPAGLLGVMLESDDDGVKVVGFGDNSAAESAGINKGDLIVTVDGQRVQAFADIKLVLMHKRPGETVVVEIGREGEAAASRIFDVTLR